MNYVDKEFLSYLVLTALVMLYVGWKDYAEEKGGEALRFFEAVTDYTKKTVCLVIVAGLVYTAYIVGRLTYAVISMLWR